jgi:hypothetical protein
VVTISPVARQLDETLPQYKKRLVLNKESYGLSWNDIAQLWFDHTGERKSGDCFRNYRRRLLNKNNPLTLEQSEKLDTYKDKNINPNNYKESIEINKDGTQSSNKLIRMSIEESKDPSFLLRAHGYDPNEWELISAKSKIWNAYSKQDGTVQLYASSISVKPKTNGFTIDKLLEEIRKVPPAYVKREYKNVSDKRLLEIPFFDSHFGISDFDYYKTTQDDTMDLIESREWEEVVFIIGQDMLHNDNFRGQTANGTQIEAVDMAKAWRDAKQFYYPLVEKALEQANRVKIIYSKGNHDESMSWAFVQLLKERFPQVEIDDSFVERKIHTFGKVFIGITHGDKARKNLHNLFQVEFPMEWAQSQTREIHSGHLHTEDCKDWFGMMVRTLATRNKTDKWHMDNGYVGNHKRFMLFEYDEKELKSIHYV